MRIWPTPTWPPASQSRFQLAKHAAGKKVAKYKAVEVALQAVHLPFAVESMWRAE